MAGILTYRDNPIAPFPIYPLKRYYISRLYN